MIHNDISAERRGKLAFLVSDKDRKTHKVCIEVIRYAIGPLLLEASLVQTLTDNACDA